MSRQDEERALLRMAFRGYLIHGGAIWYILNDDGDQGLDEVRIASWTGLAEDAYNHLEAHGWPTDETIICPICKTNEVEFLGDDCYDCASNVRDELRGESILSEQRGK